MINKAPTQADAARVNPRSSAVSPTPQWASTFAQIGSTTGGYAWAALLNGVCVSQDGVGNAQMPVAGASAVAWTSGTLCNLASISKTITATAIFMLIQQGLIRSVNELALPFIDSYIKKTYPDYKPLPGFETITIAELLNMTSRLMPNGWVEDAPLDWLGGPPAFINWYTQKYGIDPTQTYRYSNANFVILQAVVDALTGGYEAYVQKNIFGPMAVNDMTITQPSANQALPYGASPPTTQQSTPFETANLLGAGGWIGSALGVATFAYGLRIGETLHPEYVGFMQNLQFGWYHGGTSSGLCYHHNGGLSDSGNEVNTGVVSFPAGYDVALLVNHPLVTVPGENGIIGVMIDAFDAG